MVFQQGPTEAETKISVSVYRVLHNTVEKIWIWWRRN